MSDKFSVGEIAIYVRPGSPYFGQEVTVLSSAREEFLLDHITKKNVKLCCHRITCPTGYTERPNFSAPPEWLKKKQHKRDIDQLVSWSDCLWQPSGVTTCKQ